MQCMKGGRGGTSSWRAASWLRRRFESSEAAGGVAAAAAAAAATARAFSASACVARVRVAPNSPSRAAT